MSAGVWLTVSQIAQLYGEPYDTVRNWVRRDRVTHRIHYGTREVNAESVERYLSTRGLNGIRKDYRKGDAA